MIKMMKKGFLFCLVLAQAACLFNCSNKINNAEYNDYLNKVKKIVNDFIPSDSPFKKQLLKRKVDKDDGILSIIDKAEGKEQKPDIANAFEQSFYIPVVVGKGLTEYRKQTNFYNVTAFVGEQFYVKTYLEDEVISTNVYIPSELSVDGVGHYLYFSVDYKSENDYKFSGVETTDDNSIEWYFYGDNTLLFLEYSKTPERTVINYQNSNLESKEISEENVVLEVRNKLDNYFSLINKNNFKNLKNESRFDISKKEYSNILDDLFVNRDGTNLEGLQVYDGVALGYIAQKNETTISLPNSVTAIANRFYISSPNGNIKELFIPKSVTKIVDQSGNNVDISSFEIEYRNDNNFYFLEKISVEEGSSLFKTDGICLTNSTEDTLLYIMNKNVSDLDLTKYQIYSNNITNLPLPDCIGKLKIFKYNLVKPNGEDYLFDIFLNQYTHESLEFDTINYDYLEVCNIENEYSFSVYNRNIHIKKLVLNGTFEKVYVDDNNGAISNVEIKSTNPNACVLGVLNGIEVFDIYNNNTNEETIMFCENIKKIIVHEGVSEFSLDRFNINYFKEGYFELYLPSTLKKLKCEQLSSGDKILKVKIISKANGVMFTNFSRLKASGCEILIEDNKELNTLFSNYESVTYTMDNESGEFTYKSIRLGNYIGNDEELYVPDKVNDLPVTEFYISSRSSINYEPMTNAKTLKRLHLPKSLNVFRFEQCYYVNGDDYSDERNYHLDSVYYDGTYDEFRSFFDYTRNLIEHKFCKEIVFLDQVIKDNTPEIHEVVFYNDLNIMIEEKGEDGSIINHNITITGPSIRFENDGYFLDLLIDGKIYNILLENHGEFCNGVYNHNIIGKMEFLFYYNDASLKMRYTYNGVEKEEIFKKIK